MRLYEVGERLYVSAFPRERDLPQIQAAGINAVLTFSKKRLPHELHYAIGIGGYMPIPDGKYPSRTQVETCVEETEYLLRLGYTVLLHCLAGRNRSAMVAALVEARRWGWTGQQALDHIRAMRPNAIHNPAFERLILGYDEQ